MYNQLPSITSKHKLATISDDISVALSQDNMQITFHKDAEHVQLAKLPMNLSFLVENKELYLVSVLDTDKNFRRIFFKKILGTYTSLVNNAIKGLLQNFSTTLTILGVGYKFYDEQSKNGCIRVAIGLSHPVFVLVREGVKVSLARDNVHLTIQGPNKELVGLMASKFLMIKKFNRYSMSGIKYSSADIKKKVINKKN